VIHITIGREQYSPAASFPLRLVRIGPWVLGGGSDDARSGCRASLSHEENGSAGPWEIRGRVPLVGRERMS
jgi:hypothetical protein